MIIAVLGAGSWGTALALHLARQGHSVKLWCHRAEHAETLTRDRQNARYLPGSKLPDNITPTSSLDELAATGVTDYVLVVPSSNYHQTVIDLAAAMNRTARSVHNVVCCSKGFDPQSQYLLGDLCRQELPAAAGLALSGPSFASDLAAGLPVAVTLAGSDDTRLRQVHEWFHGSNLRVYLNTDYRGVQVAGAIKNVMAIATGISDGIGLGASARAALITRGLAELVRLGTRLGGQSDTFYGLSGVGDLVLTCTDDKSRNRRAGLGLGQGQSLEAVLANIGQRVEGVDTVRSIYSLCKKHDLDMPISTEVYRVLHENKSPQQALQSLLERQPGSEM